MSRKRESNRACKVELTPTIRDFLEGKHYLAPPEPGDRLSAAIFWADSVVEAQIWAEYGKPFLEAWNREHPDRPHPLFVKFGAPAEREVWKWQRK
ncbi:MAG: hypothetical protein EG824_06900 [Deltaproteobacteria bacterium]|nr:hypothetical protein [Deltaproteobacteria bacterium]